MDGIRAAQEQLPRSNYRKAVVEVQKMQRKLYPVNNAVNIADNV